MSDNQAEVLTRDDVTQTVIDDLNKLVSSKGLLRKFNEVLNKLTYLSNYCDELPTKDWIDNNYPSVLSLDFNNVYNNVSDKYLSAYVGFPISATFLQAANRINDIIIYTAMSEVEPITATISYDNIERLQEPTVRICKKAGMTDDEISVDNIYEIADMLNYVPTKLKVFGPNASLNMILLTYLIRQRVLEYKIALLLGIVDSLWTSKTSLLESIEDDIRSIKQSLQTYANSTKVDNLNDDPFVNDVANKVDEIITTTNNAADALINVL